MSKKDQYKQKQKEKLMSTFNNTTQNLFDVTTNYRYTNDTFNKEQHFRNINSLFDYIVENQWVFEAHNDLKETNPFRNLIERKLIEFMIQDPEYTWNSLHYLEKICNIHIKAENDENDEMVEFITTSDGEKIYV